MRGSFLCRCVSVEGLTIRPQGHPGITWYHHPFARVGCRTKYHCAASRNVEKKCHGGPPKAVKTSLSPFPSSIRKNINHQFATKQKGISSDGQDHDDVSSAARAAPLLGAGHQDHTWTVLFGNDVAVTSFHRHPRQIKASSLSARG